MPELKNCINNIIQCFINKPVESYEKIEKYGLSALDLKQLNHERKIFQSLTQCFNKYKTINKEAVKIRLREEFGESESTIIIDEFFQSLTYNLEDLEVHIKLIKSASIRNHLIKEVDDLRKTIYDFNAEDSLTDLYLKVSKKTGTIHDHIIDPNESVSRVGELIDDLKVYFASSGDLFIPTGYPLFDAAMGGGLPVASTTVVESRSNVGKSFFGLNIAFNIALNGHDVLYLDAELEKRYYMTRLLSLASGIPINFIKKREKWDQYPEIASYLNMVLDTIITKIPLHYKYIGGLSLGGILSQIRQFTQNFKSTFPVVVYDYLLVTHAGELLKSKLNETQILGNMMSEIQDMNVRYNVPLLLLSQTNREGVEKSNDATIAMSDRVFWRASEAARLYNVPSDEAAGLGYDKYIKFSKSRVDKKFIGKIKYKDNLAVAKLDELDDVEI